MGDSGEERGESGGQWGRKGREWGQWGRKGRVWGYCLAHLKPCTHSLPDGLKETVGDSGEERRERVGTMGKKGERVGIVGEEGESGG